MSELRKGDIIEFDIEPEHWDAVGNLDDGAPRIFEVSSDGFKCSGHLIEILDRPRVAVEIDDNYSIN